MGGKSRNMGIWYLLRPLLGADAQPCSGPDWAVQLTGWSTLALAVFALLTAIYAILTYRQSKLFERFKLTSEKLYSESFTDFMKQYTHDFAPVGGPLGVRQLVQKGSGVPEVWFQQLRDEYERIALGYHAGVYDERLLFGAFWPAFAQIFYGLESFFLDDIRDHRLATETAEFALAALKYGKKNLPNALSQLQLPEDFITRLETFKKEMRSR